MELQFNFGVVEEKVFEKKASGRVATPKNPEGMRIRLFKDGAVYPSVELVERFHLEYGAKDETGEFGGSMLVRQGFDVIDSREWSQYSKDATPYIFITATPKSEAKVDLFAQVRYNEDGSPINSVLDQGSKRPELIDMIRSVYGLLDTTDAETEDNDKVDMLFGTRNYVDLEIHVGINLPVQTNIFYLPKLVAKGPNKGNQDYVRRENNVFHPLTVVNEVESVEEVNNEVN